MSFIFQPLRHLLLELIQKHGQRVTGKTLDVGCGSITRYQKLFKSSEYVKMDIEQGPNVDVVGVAESIPFPDSEFDSIVCTETVQDVFEIQKAFSEFARVLKKGGILLVSSAALFKQSNSPTDYWRFTRHSFRKLATDAGFEVEVLEQRAGFWAALAEMWTSYWKVKLNVSNSRFERLFAVGAAVIGKTAIWFDSFEKDPLREAFTCGYLMIARKK